MAAECLKDSDDDEDDESILTDTDLLKELKGLSCVCYDQIEENISSNEEKMTVPVSEPKLKTAGGIVPVIEERLNLYKDALIAVKAMNDTSKVRRYARAVKTLEDMLKSAKSGRNINEEDIPPVIPRVKSASSLPRELIDFDNTPHIINVPVDSTESKSTQNINILAGKQDLPPQDEVTGDCLNLMLRRDQYKTAALQAKRSGDKMIALKYMNISKTFDSVMEALKNGEPVDFSNMPPPPPSFEAASEPKREMQEAQTSSAIEAAALAAASEPDDPSMFSAPPAPTSILEALQQRLEKYLSTKAAAEAEGNTSKARRLQRIVKSYETAVKDYKAGKKVEFEELPTPPGFGPIPVPCELNTSRTEPSNQNAGSPAVREKKPSPVAKPTAPPLQRRAPQVPPKAAESQKPKFQRTNTSTFDKQLEFLLERQKMFREAALAAKKNGDIQQAKEYLRMSKGFDSMIEATKCGLPIDASSIPTPPQLEADFVIVDVSEGVQNEEGNAAELLGTLEKDLIQQIEVCTSNKEHFLRLGDVSSASKFEKLGLESRKDLSVIRHLIKTNGSAPKFHYETRLFSMVQCHTDLSDKDLEVTVERGINLPGKPDDLASYVKLDFPIPIDAPQKAKTHTIKDTNNPIFQEEFKFEINRKSRAQLRHFKRQLLKLEVWSRGGFLRSDSLLGTVSVKLVDLECKCTIHDCFDLMDGRKAVGGKVEVKVRIRDPLLVKQIEEVREKWLVIGR